MLPRAVILGIDKKIVLDKLPVANGAAFDSHDEEHNATCLRGTRVDLLRQISEWANDSRSEAIFWLNGMAGTGKSTISRTVAQSFAETRELGASFFFKRGEGDRSNVAKFFTTIAAQLASRQPAVAPHIQNAVDADPSIFDKAMKEQFKNLILKPLSKTTINARKLVIVVDALDECESDRDIKVIIDLFTRTKDLSLDMKIFLTSRPELPIRLGFEAITGKYKDLLLHEVPEHIVEHDISAFLEHELARIRKEYNELDLGEDWPGQERVKILVDSAKPLFIFAATICRFIDDEIIGDPEDQLRRVLAGQTSGRKSKLHATYLPVLRQLLDRRPGAKIDPLTESERSNILQEFRDIVGSIVILANPLSTTSLAHLLDRPKKDIDRRLRLLHSVLRIPSCASSPVKLLHLSFRDFLVDPQMREENPFWVDEKQSHSQLATQCLRLMRENLRRNICRLDAPGILRSDINSQSVDKYLPPELRYACLYWVYHIERSHSLICDDHNVHQFLMSHFLYWLEAMSLLRAIAEAVLVVTRLESLLKVSLVPPSRSRTKLINIGAISTK